VRYLRACAILASMRDTCEHVRYLRACAILASMLLAQAPAYHAHKNDANTHTAVGAPLPIRLVGDPTVASLKSPPLFMRTLNEHGLPLDERRQDVAPDC
jgi:hypothetical protein